MDAFGELWQRHEELTRNYAKLLHDDAGQVLTAIALRLSSLDVDKRTEAEIAELQSTLDDLLERFRNAQASLGAAAVAKRGLAAGLSQLARMRGNLHLDSSQCPSWQGQSALAAFRIIESLEPRALSFSPQAIRLQNPKALTAYHQELALRGKLSLQAQPEGITISIQHGD